MSDGFRKFNIRLSGELYDWLDAESKRTGVAKTAYIVMALETYRRQNDAMAQLEFFEKHFKGGGE